MQVYMMNKVFFSLPLAMFVYVAMYVNVARAQSVSDVESFLPNEIAGVAIINNPPEVWNAILDMPFWKERHFLRALELADLWEFLSNEDQSKLVRFGQEFADSLNDVQTMTIVVHEMPTNDNESLRVSVLFQGDHETRQDIDASCQRLNRFLETGELLGQLLVQFFDQDEFPKLQIDLIGDWLVVSNSANDVDKMKRLYQQKEDSGRRSTLADFRRYQRIWKTVFPVQVDSPKIVIYGNPSKMRSLFSKIDDDQWRAYRPGEVIAVLARCEIHHVHQQIDEQPADLNSVDSFHPVITFQVTAGFTEPLTGLGKVLDTSGELDVWPPMPKCVYSIEASARKPAERLEVMRSFMNERKGENAWQEYVDKIQRSVSVDVENDRVPSSRGHFIVRHLNGRHFNQLFPSINNILKISIVADSIAMHRYFDSLIYDWNRRLKPPLQLKSIPTPTGRFFSRDDAGFRAFTRDMFDEASDEEFEKILEMESNDAFYHDEEWLFEGDRQFVEELMDQLPQQQNTVPWEFLVRLNEQGSATKRPYRIRLFSPMAWPAYYEFRYARDHFSPQELETEFFGGEPNDFGCVIKPEDAETAVVAIKTLVARALANEMGWQYYGEFWENNNMSIYGAIGSASASQKSPIKERD